MPDETFDEKQTRLRDALRAEKNTLAHDVAPSQAGDELDHDSDAFKAKEKEKADARRRQQAQKDNKPAA